MHMSWHNKVTVGAAVCVCGMRLCAAGSVHVIDLRCEYRENPLGIDVTEPRLSWRIGQVEGRRGIRQTAYQVRVASSTALLEQGEGNLWDSGKVESDQTFHVAYAGVPLQSRMQAYWQVRVWDEGGQASDWSAPARWTMGLLDRDEWQAEWIGYDAAYVLTPEERADNRLFSLGGLPWVEVERGHGSSRTPTGFRYRVALPEDRVLRRAICSHGKWCSGICRGLGHLRLYQHAVVCAEDGGQRT